MVSKRDKTYTYYVVKIRQPYGKTKIRYMETKPNSADKHKEVLKTFTSKGWEIAKELKVCRECVK